VSEKIVQWGEWAALVNSPVVLENRVVNAPAREAIDDKIKLVLGRAFRRRTVPGKHAFIKPVYFIEKWQLQLQSRGSFGANGFTEASNNRVFVLANDKEHRTPLKSRKNKDETQYRHGAGLQNPDQSWWHTQ